MRSSQPLQKQALPRCRSGSRSLDEQQPLAWEHRLRTLRIARQRGLRLCRASLWPALQALRLAALQILSLILELRLRPYLLTRLACLAAASERTMGSPTTSGAVLAVAVAAAVVPNPSRRNWLSSDSHANCPPAYSSGLQLAPSTLTAAAAKAPIASGRFKPARRRRLRRSGLRWSVRVSHGQPTARRKCCAAARRMVGDRRRTRDSQRRLRMPQGLPMSMAVTAALAAAMAPSAIHFTTGCGCAARLPARAAILTHRSVPLPVAVLRFKASGGLLRHGPLLQLQPSALPALSVLLVGFACVLQALVQVAALLLHPLQNRCQDRLRQGLHAPACGLLCGSLQRNLLQFPGSSIWPNHPALILASLPLPLAAVAAAARLAEAEAFQGTRVDSLPTCRQVPCC